MSNNVIAFKTAPRPLYEGRSKFPYEKVLESLKVLDSTKSLIFPTKEISTYHFHKLRKLGALVGLTVKKAELDGSVFIWANK